MRGSFRARVRVALTTVFLVAASLVVLQPPAVRADLQNPRQDFLRGAQGGLFIHWGERTAPQHTNCTTWENDVLNGGWNADYWVNEAKKLHVRYIVLATFHSRLGYARPWPSAIPGSCHTSHDFVRDLIDATNAANMKTILYLTDDPQWHNQGLSSGDWLNSSAYSNFKGQSVDLTTRDGFGQFSYDNFFEVMNRYPDLGGFWIDNDNQYWLDHNLYAQVYQQRPNYTISNNNEDTPIMDMISNEQKTGMTPSYDYPQAVFTAAPRLIEADYKLPSTGNWWYDGSNSTVDQKLTLGRYLTNAGSSIKSLMAETAQVNGRFPSNQETFNNFADTYLSAIWGSISGTEGGGYLFGGLKPGFWNDGAHGVTTISRTNPNLHFIHVITKPSTSTLRLRDNGYKVTSVTNFRTGATISFSQSGGTLTLSGISSWDQFDTVFQVNTAGRQNIYPATSYTMSATASANGHAASAAADSSYLTFWDTNKTTPVSLMFDLGSTKRIQYIGVNQREDSVAYARSDTEQSARIKAYRVFVSGDGTNWGSPIATGTLPSARGVAMIDLPATNTRHVRLEVQSTYAASTDTTRFKRLRVDEAWIASDYAGSGGGTGPSTFEAENATCQGTIDSDHAGFTGTGFCNTDNAAGAFAEWTVPAATAGSTTLTIRYSNGTTADRLSDISVNGTSVSNGRSFPSTGDWTSWVTTSLPVTLNAGNNLIRVTGTTANGAANLDNISIG